MSRLIQLSLLMTLILWSCKGDPEKITIDDLGDNQYEGKYVELEGRVSVPTQFYSFGYMQFVLYNEELHGIHCSIMPGSDENEMEELADNYSEEDLKIIDDNGEVISAGDEVIVRGEVLKDDRDAWIDVRVEQIIKK